MHELEKRALEDPFLADALEGYSNTTASDHGLSILQRQLHERIGHQQENKKVFDLSWQRLSVAAAAAVMFISAGVLFWMNSQVADQEIAADHKRVEVNITPVDSLKKEEAIVAALPQKPEEIKRTGVQAVQRAENAGRPTVKSKASAGFANNKTASEDLIRKTQDAIIAEKQAERFSAARSMRVEGLSLNDSAARSVSAAARPQLSEVVVSSIAADSQKKAAAANQAASYREYIQENVFKASPVGGWDAYRSYLKESIEKAASSVNQKGKVIIGFKVNQQGILSDFKVLKGLSAHADSLAIQIIKSGAAWQTASDVKVASLNIEFEF